MPIVQVISGELRDKAIELERKARADGASTWDIAFNHGFREGLRAAFPQETMGMLVMDVDCALDGVELYTDCLPRLALR